MRYEKVLCGKFIDRPNRFIAHVEVDGRVETVHVKNTGRCKELLVKGCTVILEDFRGINSSRKTLFDLIAVYKVINGKNVLINMDSQAPNKVVKEWLESLDGKEGYDFIKPEYTFGKSRVDFYMERGDGENKEKFLMEVKGCTLEVDGIGYFPDAPTERGVKHLKELGEACKKGYFCTIAFVIQIPEVKKVLPNNDTHAEFGKALDEAVKNGVKILYLQCDVKEDELKIIKADFA